MTKTEKAILWMEEIASDNTHGYSQTIRWSPSYDCSSMVISAWQEAGVPVKDRGATFTGNMYEVFLSCGFADVTATVNLNSGNGLLRGDVLLNDANHTAMYCGNGELVHARSSNGTDNTIDDDGTEIRKQAYFNYPWNHVLRYKENTEQETEETQTEEDTEEYVIPDPDIPAEQYEQTSVTVQPIVLQEYTETGVHICRPSEVSYYVWAMQYLLKSNDYFLQADGYYANETAKYVLKFQRDNNLEVDALVGEETWNALFRGKTLFITDEGFDVRALQYLLKAHEYFVYTDEIFGSQTYTQLVRFQSNHGLPANGICDKATWNELIKN